jgi:hypothetical protein
LLPAVLGFAEYFAHFRPFGTGKPDRNVRAAFSRLAEMGSTSADVASTDSGRRSSGAWKWFARAFGERRNARSWIRPIVGPPLPAILSHRLLF